tara:strand:- start:88 stop:261 length:174 start_codon:yes stop_codon:yes gene_type:complete
VPFSGQVVPFEWEFAHTNRIYEPFDDVSSVCTDQPLNSDAIYYLSKMPFVIRKEAKP